MKNEVRDLLKRRCDFQIREIFYINPMRKLPPIMELSNSLKTARLKVPQDFLDFYMQFDGGEQQFSVHGWQECPRTLSLSLYSVEEMKKKNKELMQLAQSAVAYECRKAHLATSAVMRQCETIASIYRNTFVIGEIGDVYPLRENLSYLLYNRRTFFIMRQEDVTQFQLSALASYFEACQKGALVSDSFAGILNKLLDEILQGHETFTDFMEAKKQEQQRLAEQQRQAEQQQAAQPKQQAVERRIENPLSIYLSIRNAMRDGKLPEDFTIVKSRVKKEDEDSVKWAPGALDGVMLYHTEFRKPTEKDFELFGEMLEAVQNGAWKEAIVPLLELLEKDGAIVFADALQSFIIERRETVDAVKLKQFATWLALNSTEAEWVKIALVLYDMLYLRPQDIEIIYNLGLCEEFTFFAVHTLKEEHNDLVFDLAKATHGWGRIHAVRVLKPENEIMRKWLLFHGIQNEVLPQYSAWFAWDKSCARELLLGEEKLSREVYSAIRNLLFVMLDEAPCRGISLEENAEECILKFLEKSAFVELTKVDARAIKAIREEFGIKRDHPNVVAIATLIINKLAETRGGEE